MRYQFRCHVGYCSTAVREDVFNRLAYLKLRESLYTAFAKPKSESFNVSPSLSNNILKHCYFSLYINLLFWFDISMYDSGLMKVEKPPASLNNPIVDVRFMIAYLGVNDYRLPMRFSRTFYLNVNCHLSWIPWHSQSVPGNCYALQRIQELVQCSDGKHAKHTSCYPYILVLWAKSWFLFYYRDQYHSGQQRVNEIIWHTLAWSLKIIRIPFWSTHN